MSELKTAEETLKEIIFSDMENISVSYDDRGKRQIIETMQAHTKQALEEYRDSLLLELPAAFKNSDAVKYRVKVGLFILDINLTQFIK